MTWSKFRFSKHWDILCEGYAIGLKATLNSNAIQYSYKVAHNIAFLTNYLKFYLKCKICKGLNSINNS